MTLDEAIKHAEEVAEEQEKLGKCAEEHRQLAEWLRELRVLRTKEENEMVRCENCKHQDECEEVVLYEVTDDEVIGHRVHWCSYGRR